MSPETISAVDQLPTREKVCVIPCAKAHRPSASQTGHGPSRGGKGRALADTSSIRAKNKDASPPTAPIHQSA